MHASFRRLVRIYIMILAACTVLVAGLAGFLQIRSFDHTLAQNQDLAVNRVGETIERYQNLTNDFATQLAATADDLANVDVFFHASLADYATYAIDHSQGSQYFFLPNEVTTLLIRYPMITKLRIQVPNSNETYVVTQKEKGGSLVREQQDITGFTLTAPLINSITLKNAGTLSLTFDPDYLRRDLTQLHTQAHLQVAVVSDTNRLLFHYVDSQVIASNERKVATTATKGSLQELLQSQAYQGRMEPLGTNNAVAVLVNSDAHRNQLWGLLAPILTLAAVMLGILILSLFLTFRRYQTQLTAMIQKMHQIGKGQLGERLAKTGNNDDLNVLATGVNDMLTEINQYVYQIYQLKIAQQDANMKALQAQINPHFMYNTLEYIRMAALDAGQRDLAQVVFSFASLLRNNTDQGPTATLGDELRFIEKYIYLYQVRYPKQLAYQIRVPDDLQQLVMPKFTLQPLVENYFVHGVNFARQDNAISITARHVGDHVEVAVINNGQSLSEAELLRVNQHIVQPIEGPPQSIGLQNVYARLAQFFGDSVALTLHRNAYGGITTTVVFRPRYQKGEEQHDRHDPGR
ncbi:two-component sensor histidine kinase [Schleiferilactobacillus harbinensis]|uniref:Sensor histidine kinase n=3 Tax=Schleiferilactobacillus harbinensis TaxID=304207 RepID=A0A5P8Q092_9LACO|nr:sensor histidine kinase [Schleiferilactobacillus harbinensis]KRM29968.1 histidine protein kinase [Schleiferilactobacillus harbinensis DSM 16991]QFR24491.1 two-component sensor histidine kinase [Schleiferilactobacillus harbinensis]QFR62939.1 two-component sensor histidine kinase [Schleiferilactobacillus harbinensis]